MRILGIDPGLATIGLGLIEAESAHRIRCLEWLIISTPAGESTALRMEEIHRDLKQFLKESRPALAVVERLFFKTNAKTAISVAQARGVILLTLAENQVPVIEPSPLQLKSAITGDGRADKRQMQDMLARMLELTEIPKPDDAADALALAVYGALTHKMINV